MVLVQTLWLTFWFCSSSSGKHRDNDKNMSPYVGIMSKHYKKRLGDTWDHHTGRKLSSEALIIIIYIRVNATHSIYFTNIFQNLVEW